jgi:uncharacterized protein (DUF1684 family)
MLQRLAIRLSGLVTACAVVIGFASLPFGASAQTTKTPPPPAKAAPAPTTRQAAPLPAKATQPPPLAVDPAYAREIAQWRSEREAALKTDDGWLTLVGLFWLQEGTTCAGSAPACRVALAAGSAPSTLGTFTLATGTVTFAPAAGVDVRINGKPAATQALSSQPGRYDKVSTGTFTLFVIKRGPRYGIRVRDTNSQARRTFQGVEWFPVTTASRVTARFVTHAKPTTIMIANVLGDVDPWPSPGYAEFTLGGKPYRLHAVLDGPSATDLFFIFRDLTTGKETYPAGRFLYAAMPVNGEVVLDFNKAHSPPCAFTAYATCPLPPKENTLAVRVAAGELNPHQAR